MGCDLAVLRQKSGKPTRIKCHGNVERCSWSLSDLMASWQVVSPLLSTTNMEQQKPKVDFNMVNIVMVETHMKVKYYLGAMLVPPQCKPIW